MKVLLVVKKTREVPTGHNVGQRMARLIRAVELGIPTIYFCPFKTENTDNTPVFVILMEGYLNVFTKFGAFIIPQYIL